MRSRGKNQRISNSIIGGHLVNSSHCPCLHINLQRMPLWTRYSYLILCCWNTQSRALKQQRRGCLPETSLHYPRMADIPNLLNIRLSPNWISEGKPGEVGEIWNKIMNEEMEFIKRRVSSLKLLFIKRKVSSLKLLFITQEWLSPLSP